ncbi:putative two-component system sensor kinase [Pseudonocardia sp. Ae168_Ps1]|uniref:sensor histidine kinase n=1 Tax=unclassified Pseudonocardia TaxID=2619320 RepID=UPI00094B1C2F|nr:MULTISPECIES: sensor domain-containing protein [unclassified Pseudonocardia]OLL71185.1 putative two-component system sensor kinase [Pseudonocardia sp. Ae168_Ps1]OLL77263.1 putative two-component system sensor kinase [Pseudonocardia sp. Ae150A_Ps1]OLL88628.1 putative two-component system sensor kinase [Pseudonocardia sp. Ae263_Ps1]OLL91351.1 putative two-component system sensor kinase [Pseudonocardia sp. Ae356_Ps1]
MRIATAWQAMDQQPLRFLATPWPWRSLGYLVTGAALGAVVLGAFAVPGSGLVLGGPALAVGTGSLLVLAVLSAGRPLAALERRRLRLVDDEPLPAPPRPPGPWWRAAVTWREVGFALLVATGLAALDACVLGFSLVLPVLLALSPVDDPTAWPLVIVGVLLLLAAPWTVTAWAGARAALTRTVLGPRGAELGPGIADVATRRLIGAFETERARIERDLHDGAQQRLVALGVTLGLARLDAADGSPAAARLDDARDQLGLALAELRDLVRGLDPRTLADDGLAAAVEDHAARCPVPTEVDLRPAGLLPPRVATTAYFVLVEALTNTARHSGARSATVTGRRHADQLVLEVRDDGRGGADPGGGSGLTGLAERVALAGGRVRLSSPPGGPTLLPVELPCA